MTVHPPAGTVPVGAVIGSRYQVAGFLGNGANGDVYEVIDLRQDNRVCALKLMKTIPPGGPWHEASVLTRLEGEFVLPILNADDAAGIPYIVTEVLHNRSLDTRIPANIGVDVDQACRWTQHACRGVARIHDYNLLHNDLKPDNLFVDDDEEVMVGDLGLCCLMDASGNGHYGGTPTTMAPEVAQVMLTGGPANLHLYRPTSIASDVYSLGATLYWLLAGHPVYADTTMNFNAYITLITTGPAPNIRDVAPHVPRGLGNIVMKAISLNPADRYTSPAELDAAIGARTKPLRHWTRQQPCIGHTTCFTGVRKAHTNIALCAVPTGKGTKHIIETRHNNATGNKINPWPTVTNQAKLPQALRARFRHLD